MPLVITLVSAFSPAANDPCQEIPLSQLPPSLVPSAGTSPAKTSAGPPAQEHQNQMDESVRRLASKVAHLMLCV